MSPELSPDIAIVTLNCPHCPRAFRTLAWIAYSKAPRCPQCNVPMECSEVQDTSVLHRPLELQRPT